MQKFYTFCLAGAMAAVTASAAVPAGFGKLQPSTVTRNGSAVSVKTSTMKAPARFGVDGYERSFGRAERLHATSLRGNRAQTQTVTVTFEFPGMENGIIPQAAGLTAPDGTQYWAMQEEENGPIIARIPAGTYVICGYFALCEWNDNSEGWEQNATAYVVKENQTFTADSTMTLDGSEATNFITGTAVDPSGQPYTLQKIVLGLNDDGDIDIIDIVPGTAESIGQRMGLVHKTYGELFWSQLTGSGEWDYQVPGIDNDPPFKQTAGVYVNDFSDDIIAYAAFGVKPAEGANASLYASQSGCAPADLTPSATDYTYIASNVVDSELGLLQPYPANPEPWSVWQFDYYNGIKAQGVGPGQGDLSIFNYCATPVDGTPFRSGMQVLYADFTSEYSCDTTYYGDWMIVEEWRTSMNTLLPEVMVDNGRKTVVNATDGAYYKMPGAPTDYTLMQPSAFAYTPRDLEEPAGTSPAYPVYSVCSSADGQITPFFPGCTENSGASGAAANAYADRDPVITYNGQPVDYDTEYYSNFWSGGFLGWCMDRNDEGNPAGVYTFEFNSPQLLQGVEGFVQSNVVTDQTKADNVPPAVQWLMFRDREGGLRTSFGDTLEGVMYLCAGDFTGNDDGQLTAYVPGVTPQVSFRPFGSDQWTAANLSKLQEASGIFAPVYGMSLLQVSGKSLLGFFDLKIEMADASGNKFSSVVSPAFQIRSLTDPALGVESVKETARAIAFDGRTVSALANGIAVYTLDGRKVAASTGNTADLSGLQPGVYVARCGSASIKVVLK